MQGDLISVIVPVYNVKPYLEECMNSILNQTYKNFEVILVDDGSTDGSGEMCDEYAEKYSFIKVIHQENLGPSGARNAGVDISEGRYISFVDSDDIVAEDYLKILYENAVLYNADVSMCGYVRFRNAAEILPMTENVPHKVLKIAFLERVMCSIVNTPLVVTWNKLIRKDVAEKIMFPVGKWHEDQFYINYLMENADIFVETGAELYFYRQRPDSIMGENNKNDPRHLVVVDALKERNDFCRRVCGGRLYRKIIILQYWRKIKNQTMDFVKKHLNQLNMICTIF